MRYLKTFENYEVNSELENICKQFDIDPDNIREGINGKFDELSESQKDQIHNDMVKLSEKLGLSMEEMTDFSLVYHAIKNSKAVNLLDFQKNESRISEWFKRTRVKILKAIGLGGLALSVILLGTGALLDEQAAKSVRYEDEINASETTTMGGITAVVSLAICALALSLQEREKAKRSQKI